MKRRALYNTVVSIFSQVITVVLGLIVPRLFITNYGSDINGLLGTVSQVFAYIALLESGIGTAAQNALYKPFAEKNIDEINKLLSIAESYYRRVTVLYAFAVVILAALLPLILKTEVSYSIVFGIIILQGMSGVISFLFLETKRIVLSTDGRNYVEQNVNLLAKVLSYAIRIVLILKGANIIIIQMSYLILTVVQVTIYNIYIKRKYSWLKVKYIPSGKGVLKDRNSFVINEIAWTIFSSTDMILISAFFSTKLSSVYSVYNTLFTQLGGMLNAIYFSVIYILNQTFFVNIKKFEKLYDEYEYIFIGAISILMTSCSCLAVPFVRLYTNGVTDINYIYPLLPILMGAVQLISWYRYVSGNLACIAGYVDKTMKYSIIEAMLNILLSLILGFKFSLYGVVIATDIALLYKMLRLLILANNKILKRSCIKSIYKILGSIIVYLGFSIVFLLINLTPVNFIQFLLYSIFSFIIISIIYIIVFSCIDRQSARQIINQFLKPIKNRVKK